MTHLVLGMSHSSPLVYAVVTDHTAFADMISWTGFVTSSQPFNQGTVNTYRKKGLKVMASFGGWNLDLPFHPAVQTDETRKAFAKHVGDLVTSFGLDGADMDWE